MSESKSVTQGAVGPPTPIRNFCIIAHIDHGKSTLADQLLLQTGAISQREFRSQILDSMDLERERGITIKASPVMFRYEHRGTSYMLNLIDTPGHVDFHYEVSHALAACDGAVLLVDVSQGVEAQTVSNFYKAMEHDLVMVPVLNKIDLPGGQPEEARRQMMQAFGFKEEEFLSVSAKTGAGVQELLGAIIERVPPPKGRADGPLRALVFDSVYDDHKGCIIHLRVMDGRIKTGQTAALLASGKRYEVAELGRFRPKMTPEPKLESGEVGYCVAGIRSVEDIRIGDTLTDPRGIEGKIEPLPGYEDSKPVVFCGLYPVASDDFEQLRKALARLHLNDASFAYEPETSNALGFGFRCGFLGLLHMEIIKERLEREYDLELVCTAPNVRYQLACADGRVIEASSPSQIPTDVRIQAFREPVVKTNLIVPPTYIGAIMTFVQERRGKYLRTEYLGSERVSLYFDIPLAEIIYDFYDKLKSITRGYGTMDYDRPHYTEGDLVRLDVLVAGQPVDALSCVIYRPEAHRRGRELLLKIRKEIPKHLFEVILQASVGGKIIARESIKPMAKHVTGKCYGGDITRKQKLWKKQKAGKKRMKAVGRVEIPQSAFLAALSTR
jgi:GTP-binding protein LepA